MVFSVGDVTTILPLQTADQSVGMTGDNGVSDLNTFLAVHKVQLEGGGVPSIYWDSLHTKLSKQIFDAGAAFTILQVSSDSVVTSR